MYRQTIYCAKEHSLKIQTAFKKWRCDNFLQNDDTLTFLLNKLYGHQAILPTAVTKQLKPTYSYDDYAQELRKKIRAINQIAKDHLKQEEIKAKLQYDKSINEKTFKIGDKVLLHDETVRRRRSKKLESQLIGPYTITEKISDVNYAIKGGRKTICMRACK